MSAIILGRSDNPPATPSLPNPFFVQTCTTGVQKCYKNGMGEIVGVVCMSHAPFWDSRDFDRSAGEFMAGAAAARDLVEQMRLTAMVVIGPDHFRNFFYDAMPAFCIGLERIASFGDFSTPRTDLPAASALARAIHRELREQGFDLGVSLHMGVDHGVVQAAACVCPALDIAVVPLMVACTGAAMPTMARCAAIGAALGAAIRQGPADERVVIVASGGLSHWLPPTDPDHPAIDPDLRDFVVDGRPRAREYQSAREERLLAMAASLRGRVNDEWDRWVLERIATADLAPLAALADEQIERDGGNGGQEIRAWLIGAAAWGQPIGILAYEPRPDWLTGMGVAAATCPPL